MTEMEERTARLKRVLRGPDAHLGAAARELGEAARKALELMHEADAAGHEDAADRWQEKAQAARRALEALGGLY